MELNEYHVSKESITLSKAALEKWRDHYNKVVDEIPEDHPSRQFMVGLYCGKRDALIDILKHFEDED